MSNHKNKICPVCGMKFYVKPSAYQRRTYCSMDCMRAGYKARFVGSNNPNFKNKLIQKKCVVCGKPFTTYLKRQKLCSYQCLGKVHSKERSGQNSVLWRGGSSMLIRRRISNCDWKRISQKIRKRDQNKCQKCGKTGKLDVHHIKPVRIGGSNELTNLILLCPRCHKIEENKILNNGI